MIVFNRSSKSLGNAPSPCPHTCLHVPLQMRLSREIPCALRFGYLNYLLRCVNLPSRTSILLLLLDRLILGIDEISYCEMNN